MSALRHATRMGFAALLFAVPAASQAVVINEILYDNAGADDREFVELYNASKSPVDISAWELRLWDQRNATTYKRKYTIPANTKIAAGGFYVMGTSKVAGVNQVLGAGNLFENSQEGLVLYNPKGKRRVDSLCYETYRISATATWHKSIINGDGIWGAHMSSNTSPTSLSRVLDGYNSKSGQDWVLRPETPGKTNNLSSGAVLFDTFDKGTPEAVHKGWAGSFIPPVYIDPTKTSKHNPQVIPASPQGGKCLVIYDSYDNGGNAGVLLQRPQRDLVVECYVYIEASNATQTGDLEMWSIGVQGSTTTFFDYPDPERSFGYKRNGNTGVSATYVNSSKGSALYLIDHNDGGSDWTVLGKIVVSKGKNDGWQRLRLEVNGNSAGLWLGGKMGSGAGEVVGGRIARPTLGDIYAGSRESFKKLGANRPLTIDDLRVRPSVGAVGYYGSASATTVGVVDAFVATPPVLGSKGFGVTARRLAAKSPALLILGAGRSNLPIATMAKGTSLYTSPVFIIGARSDAKGEAHFPFPLPSNSSYANFLVNWQVFALDSKLSAPMPMAASQGIETRLSN